jgi:hypothetical protein
MDFFNEKIEISPTNETRFLFCNHKFNTFNICTLAKLKSDRSRVTAANLSNICQSCYKKHRFAQILLQFDKIGLDGSEKIDKCVFCVFMFIQPHCKFSTAYYLNNSFLLIRKPCDIFIR